MDATLILVFVLMVGAAIALGLLEKTTRPRRARKPYKRWQGDAKYSENEYEAEGYPYRARKNLLTPTELEFYQVLRDTLGSRAVVCPKVRLGDIVEVDWSQTNNKVSHENRINRKHTDFLLCHPVTMKPLLGIELDDSSHQRPDRQERDDFVNAAYAAAGLPLVHIATSQHYTRDKVIASLAPYFRPQPAQSAAPLQATAAAQSKPGFTTQAPRCAKCGSDMVVRTIRTGERAGEQFWGCSSYPECRHRMPLESSVPAQK